MENFEEFGLSQSVLKSLFKMEYQKPTPIQAKAIPHALSGRDIMGTAQTGTGKTAAFAIPLIEHLLSHKDSGTALVLTPTRELGKQIMEIMHQLLGEKSKINTAFIIGGEPYFKQMKQLKQNPRLIVGTPGRINDHLEQGTLDLSEANFLVLDETDRMLDMGFSVQLDRIFKFMPEQRQTLMFSATMPKEIKRMVNQYLEKPEYISVGEVNTIATNIKQEMIRIEQPQKYDELKSQLEQREGSVIVFIKTKHGADKMAKNLRRDGFTSEALHGDLRQNRRDKVMMNFRKQNFRVLIATDIAARGLDVPHIEHVVNFDLPQVAEDFIHRMGRTARAGADGEAISFVAGHDMSKWRAIERLIDPEAAANDRGGKKDGRKRNAKNKRRGFKKNENFAGYEEDRKVEDKKSFKKKKPFARNDDAAPKKERSKKRDGEQKRFHADDKPKSKRPYKKEENRSENRGDRRQERSFDKPRGGNNERSDGQKTKKHFGAKRDDNRNENRQNRDFKGDNRKNENRKKEGFKKDGFKKDGFKKDGFKSNKPRRSEDGEARPSFKGQGKKSSFKGKAHNSNENSRSDRPAQNRGKSNDEYRGQKQGSGQKPKQGGKPQNRKHFGAPKRRNKAA
jgi:superfamily II DNA/RNA helicase